MRRTTYASSALQDWQNGPWHRASVRLIIANDLTMKRELLLEEHDIDPGDDEALYSDTPFIDALSKKEAIDND